MSSVRKTNTNTPTWKAKTVTRFTFKSNGRVIGVYEVEHTE